MPNYCSAAVKAIHICCHFSLHVYYCCSFTTLRL